jgi:hypothetical protein
MACMDCAKDFEELDDKIAKLQSQLDELIGSIYDHCNAFTEPYCIAERIERESK